MPLEIATYISGLNASNPVGVSDPKSQGDDHLRLIKATLLNTFPNLTGAMNATQAELNRLVGVTGPTGSGALVLGTGPTISGPTITGAIAGGPSIAGATLSAPTISGAIAGTPDTTGSWTLKASIPFLFSPQGDNQIYTNWYEMPADGGQVKWSVGMDSSGGLYTYFWNRYDASGGFLDRPIQILNTSGVVLFASRPQFAGNEALDAGNGARLAAANIFTNTQIFSSASPQLRFHDTDGGTNEKYWLDFFDGVNRYFTVYSDDLGTQGTIWLQVTRSGNAVTGIKFGAPVQAPTAISTETSGALTAANSCNKIVRCSGDVTLPPDAVDGDVILIDPRGTARTITRPGSHTMYISDVNSATGTTAAHNIVTAKYHGSSKWTLQGAVS